MALSAGDKLGPYEIIEPIGQGGMGAVYRARDTRLGRDVAVKVSEQHFSERFEREARVISSLNHPNICHLYDVGDNYLVMELVEGQTLAERIKQGAIPLEESLAIARQVTDALEAAHEKGITHRDLKPGNVMVKEDGSVKVLDFGLAKVGSAGAPDSADPELSPTISMAATQAGVILGTAAYMSPEQARGKPVDKRADIWAFGVVLHEMVTGKRLFQGEDLTQTLAAVVMKDPDLDEAPYQVRRLLKKCLQKEPKHRLRDIGDAWDYLDSSEPAAAAAATPESPKLAWIAAAVATLAFLGLAGWSFVGDTVEPAPVVKTAMMLPEGMTLPNTAPPAISPDGRRVVFVAIKDGTLALWIRDLNALEARMLPGTEGALRPFWSPDSRSVGFFATQKLKKIDVTGGPPITITDVGESGSGAWGANDMIVFENASSGGFLRVPAAGGTPTQILAATTKYAPWFLPDGRHFLYTGITEEDEESAIYVGDVQASEADNAKNRKALVYTGSNAAYAEPGYLLFVREGTLMAQPFDASTLATTGDAGPIAEQVAYGNLPAPAQFSVSRNGVLVYVTGSASTTSQLTWFDRSGKNLGTIGNPGLYGALAISPDGSRVAVEMRDGDNAGDLWLIDAAPGGKSDRFTFDPERETSPVWSPDGTRIAFAANPGGGPLNLFQKPSNLAGREEELFQSEGNKNMMDWSLDGKTLSFSPYNPNSDVWTLSLSDKEATLFYKSDDPAIRDYGGRFSPDGRWLAYNSQVTGSPEVYVRPFPENEAGGQQMVSLGGGTFPLWREDGKELYYRAPGGDVMAVEVTPGDVLKFGQPQSLFRAGQRPSANGPYYQWDATADGSRFLLNLAGDDANQGPTPLTLVQNWAAGLQ